MISEVCSQMRVTLRISVTCSLYPLVPTSLLPARYNENVSGLSAVPLFPLPGVVLFPRAVLPLHIFEERYKRMTADVLRGHRQIAMALLRTGWQKDYYARPEIEPVVCVGTILSHERLPDGRYNFLLQGHTRARVVEEMGDEPYRQARLEPLTETDSSETDLSDARQRLTELFDQGSYAA